MKIFLLPVSSFLLFFNVQSMKLPNDIWTKIIACSSRQSKESLKKCCTTLHSLSSKNNLTIYLNSPLVLTQKQKEYALSYCAYKQHIPALKNLLNHGAYTAYTHCGMATSPESIAKYHNNHELMSIVGKWIHNNLEGKIVPYALAAYVGDIKLLRKYIKSKKYNPLYKNRDHRWTGSTLLYPAIFNGHRDVVELLLTHPQTINFINSGRKYGGRPIDIAFISGHADIAERLLTIPSLQFNQKQSARKLYYCATKGYSQCIEILLKHKPTILCINQLHQDSLPNVLGAHGIQSLSVLFCYASSLTIAAFKGHTDVVRLLLQSKKTMINIPVYQHEKKRFYHLTPLYAASLQGKTAVVQLLLQDPKITPALYMKNYTPLHIACVKGYIDIVKLLVAYCPKLLTMKTKNKGDSPYQIAYHYNHYEIVKFLLEQSK